MRVFFQTRAIQGIRSQLDRFYLSGRTPTLREIATRKVSLDSTPFIGTPELGGLKILMMLLSDWDNKDARDAEKRGTNTAIYQHANLMYYFIDDWGGAMASSLIASLPVVIAFAAVQRFFIQGLTAGAVKS